MSYSVHSPLDAKQVENWDDETDVAIIGFGAAGASAAVAAREAGAQVMLFERASGSGGASALSGGDIYVGGSGGTDVQRNAGFEDSTEDFAAYLKAAGGPCVDEAKCDLYARDAVSHFDWLRQMGVQFRGDYRPGKIINPEDDTTLIWSGSEAAAPFCNVAKPAPRGHVIARGGLRGGRALVDVLQARMDALGAVQTLDARIVALIRDDERVVGVVARKDGRDLFVRARRGVVIATGGFTMNEDMRRKHCPDTLKLSHPLGERDDGLGIELGLGVGGDAIHMDQFFATCPWIMPESHAYGVFVNKAGQRFINEDCYHGRVSRAAIDQLGGSVYLLLDSAHCQEPLPHARIDIVATGDTWEEVEAELGMREGMVSATMAFYNRHAAQGVDPLFDKRSPILKPLDQGPFVAFELNFSTSYFAFFTLGGLRTSCDGEVLDRTGVPIAGLFAAGRCTSGLPAWGHGYSSGLSLADCTYFGRRAGRSASQSV